MASHSRFSSFVRVVCLIALLAPVLLVRTPVHAQNASEKAAAEALFDRGLTLMKEGKYQEACERLEQSQAIDRGIGTMLYLADCYERLGKTASAWALFREASSLAHAQGQSERADAGKRRAERLEKGLSKLAIQVPQASRVPGLEVQDNGAPVHPNVWSVPVPSDPGEHRVSAKAPGYRAWSQTVKVEGNGATAEISVPALERDPDAEAQPVAATTSEPASDSSQQQPVATQGTPDTRMSVQRIIGLSLGGAGVASLIVGTAFGVRAIKKADEANTDYDAASTEAEQREAANTMDKAETAAKVSNATIAIGGALVVGGLITFLVAPKYRGADVAFHVDRQTVSFRVGGAF